jgi:hypothetical protein
MYALPATAAEILLTCGKELSIIFPEKDFPIHLEIKSLRVMSPEACFASGVLDTPQHAAG